MKILVLLLFFSVSRGEQVFEISETKVRIILLVIEDVKNSNLLCIANDMRHSGHREIQN